MTTDTLLPQEPLFSTNLPRAGGQLGPEPEHFVVEELPLYEPSGTGDHWYVKLQKRALTTPELVRAISRLAGVRERDIGYAGLKDKHAVTRQWLSLPAQAVPPERWELSESLQLLEVSRHNNKLRTGHLRGNRFGIVISGVAPDARTRASAIVEAVKRDGLLNYFGAQRFGYQGQNLAKALDWLRSARGRKRSRFHDKLYPSVLQSEVFNRYLTERYHMGLSQLLEGEVVRLAGSGSVFVVEEVEREQPRLAAGDIELTGPMFGPRAVTARAAGHRLEEAALATLRLDTGELERLGKAARGTRRDLRLRPEELTLEPHGDDALRLSFSLPAGAYATQLIREVTGDDWLEARHTPAAQPD